MICEHAYARGSTLTYAFDLAGDHCAAFSIVLVGNRIAESALRPQGILLCHRRTYSPVLLQQQASWFSYRLNRFGYTPPGAVAYPAQIRFFDSAPAEVVSLCGARVDHLASFPCAVTSPARRRTRR